MAQQWPLLTNHNDHVEGFRGGSGEAYGFIISSFGCRSILQFGLTIDQFGEGGVVECGVDVVGGVEDEKVLLLLDELDGRG